MTRQRYQSGLSWFHAQDFEPVFRAIFIVYSFTHYSRLSQTLEIKKKQYFQLRWKGSFVNIWITCHIVGHLG